MREFQAPERSGQFEYYIRTNSASYIVYSVLKANTNLSHMAAVHLETGTHSHYSNT